MKTEDSKQVMKNYVSLKYNGLSLSLFHYQEKHIQLQVFAGYTNNWKALERT